jgi:hypothetical protein
MFFNISSVLVYLGLCSKHKNFKSVVFTLYTNMLNNSYVYITSSIIYEFGALLTK